MVEERDRWYWHAGTLGAHPATVCFPKAIAFDKGEGSFFTQFMRRTTALSFKNIRTPAMITSVCEISLESKSSGKRHIVPKISIAWSRKMCERTISCYSRPVANGSLLLPAASRCSLTTTPRNKTNKKTWLPSVVPSAQPLAASGSREYEFCSACIHLHLLHLEVTILRYLRGKSWDLDTISVSCCNAKIIIPRH